MHTTTVSPEPEFKNNYFMTPIVMRRRHLKVSKLESKGREEFYLSLGQTEVHAAYPGEKRLQ